MIALRVLHAGWVFAVVTSFADGNDPADLARNRGVPSDPDVPPILSRVPTITEGALPSRASGGLFPEPDPRATRRLIGAASVDVPRI